MANRHLFGHKNLEAMEFSGEYLWESLAECAAWLMCADNFDHEVWPIAVATAWADESEVWVTTLVYDDVEQRG